MCNSCHSDTAWEFESSCEGTASRAIGEVQVEDFSRSKRMAACFDARLRDGCLGRWLAAPAVRGGQWQGGGNLSKQMAY